MKNCIRTNNFSLCAKIQNAIRLFIVFQFSLSAEIEQKEKEKDRKREGKTNKRHCNKLNEEVGFISFILSPKISIRISIRHDARFVASADDSRVDSWLSIRHCQTAQCHELQDETKDCSGEK